MAETKKSMNEPDTYQSMTAEFTVEFDRKVRTSRTRKKMAHYLSPGTMLMEFMDGTVIPFDFQLSSYEVKKNNVSFFEEGLDIPVFPSSALLGQYLLNGHPIRLKINIFTGEADDPVIHPIALKSFHLCAEAREPGDKEICFEASDNLLKIAVVEDC